MITHITSVQYCGGCSVHRGITSVLWGDSFSTVEVVQYSGGITSVHVGDNISTVGDNISTVEGYLQYCGGIASVHWGITSVQWRVFSTLGDNISTVGDNISTVEGVQYSGGRILISACLVINNDEKISTFFVLRYEILIRKFFENSSRFHAF